MTLGVRTIHSPEPPLWLRVLLVLRGLWAVVELFAGALATLVVAVVGLPPDSARRVGHVIADEYRAGKAGAVDADILDEEGRS